MRLLLVWFLLVTAVRAGSLKLPGTLPSTSGYQVEDAFGGAFSFKQPLAIASPPGETGRLFIVEKGGLIHVITGYPDKPVKTVFLDLPAVLKAGKIGSLGTDGEWGVLGLAFHPRFAENGYLYVTYNLKVQEDGKTNGFDRLSRFSISKTDPNTVDPASEQPLLSQLDPAAYHNGGDIHFGPDGYLYYCMGDGGGHYDPYDNARFIDKDFLAALYRIDVDGKPGSLEPNVHSQKSAAFPSAIHPGSYKIPADNPFIGAAIHNGKTLEAAKIRTEVFACGFRNPWRFSFDSKDGGLYLGVVGEDRWEQVYQIEKGGNYGWSYYEGSHDGPRLKDKPAGAQFDPPIYEYPHGNDTIFSGNSVTGGVVYRGKRLPEMEGAYIFGDYISHCVWSIRKKGEVWEPALLVRSGAVSAFGTDPVNGDVLLADIDRGRIQRLVRAPEKETAPPALLSQTGAFVKVETLEPAPGVIAYDVNHGAWNGGATSRRWFSLPGTEKIGFHRDGHWRFPVGTAWIQQLDAPGTGKKLETRFLVKTESAIYGISYKWREDQSDADLVPDAGVPSADPTKAWHFPGRAECVMCHTSIAGYTLGMNTWQLNRPAPGNPSVNQLRALIDGGYLQASDDDIKNAPSFASIDDTVRSLEDRCRSYLAVNCCQCHQQDGVASSPWSTKASFPTSNTRMINGGLNTDFGDRANRVIAPRDPAHSMILRRLKGDGAPRMPMGTTHPLDQVAIDVLTEWINAGAPAAH